jgi:SAM-dependent methyltransferase
VFSRIYQRNEWNGVETRSGPGSGSAATKPLGPLLSYLVNSVGIHSVIDAGCGEGYWQPDLPGYVGLDIAPEAIERARSLHPDREYRVHDIRQGCPRGDLVICRDAIQHLSLEDGLAVLYAIRHSGSAWFLGSTYVASENVDIRTGGFYSPDLEAAPFDMAPAFLYARDGFDYADGSRVRDPRKMLGLWRL